MSDLYIPSGAESAQEGQFLQSLVAGLTASEAKSVGIDKYATQLFTNFAGDYQTLAPNAPQNGAVAGYNGTFFTCYYDSSPPNYQLETIVAGIPYAGAQSYGGTYAKRWYVTPALPDPINWTLPGAVVLTSEADYKAWTLLASVNGIPNPERPYPSSAVVPPIFYRGNNQLYPINMYVSRWHSGVKIGMSIYDSTGAVQKVSIIENPPNLVFPTLSRGKQPTINYANAPDGSYSIQPFGSEEFNKDELYIINKTQLPAYCGSRGYEIVSARIDLGTPTSPAVVVVYRNNTSVPILENQDYFQNIGTGPCTDIMLATSTNLTDWSFMGGAGPSPNHPALYSYLNKSGDEYSARISTTYQDDVVRFSSFGGNPNTSASRCYIKLVRNNLWPGYASNLATDTTDVSPIYGVDLPIGSYRNVQFFPPEIYQYVLGKTSVFVDAPADFDLVKVRIASYASTNPPPAGFNAPPGGVTLFNSLDISTMPIIGCLITP